ncbi:DUF7144 family membrane protein [Nocardia seriolae]|uniref:DUF7144 domain-containing protein n=1 Tax=Nocardia seriolae TaxID=37332 RepID=A0A0B8NA20_9NOCA|nr:hypothetical protein [Nocardia seriolae]APA98075.1 hypothetical protein NS506_04027 [Nocardia seriolae]MTJ62772.1 hypothetical protein [Nocardia seriolae]MTJ73890.1 hypothetical protein [Nocardia seriolae]MTJ87805.1 hypothetical protein [Nocardia seriolae]MTK31798.1 hypothetical protein [Nocardia seriolae]
MTHTLNDAPPERRRATGGALAAAILMVTVGVLDILQGISAVAADQLYVVGVAYIYKYDTTGWGWVHIGIGAVLILCGIGLMSGTQWGRIAAMVLASLSIIANFMWLPYYPAWAILVILLDVVVIWAVASWQPESA